MNGFVACLAGFDSLQLMLDILVSSFGGEGFGKLTGHMCISPDCWGFCHPHRCLFYLGT